MQALRPLQMGDNLQQVARPRVAAVAEHSHQAFGRPSSHIRQLAESDRRIDEIAQYDLAGFQIPGEQILNSLPEQRLAEAGIAPHARPYGFLEISR